MVRSAVAAVLLLLVPVTASASLLEDALNDAVGATPIGPDVEGVLGGPVHYQEDGGVAGDAPDTCAEASSDRTVNFGEATTAGMLVEADDESDAYVFALDSETVGERVRLDLLQGLLNERHDLAFDVFAPGCGSSVFDPESEYYNPAPATPYEPGPGEAVVAAKLEGYDCNPAEWKFLGNQMGGIEAPSTIYVEWANGEWAYVPVSKSTPATVAMYRTDANLDAAVTQALIVLPESYKGQFKLVHGPCDVSTAPAEPPELSATRGEFTVQEAGPHVVVVYIARGAVDKTSATLQGLLANPPTSIAASCHSDICTLGFDFVNYDVGSGFA